MENQYALIASTFRTFAEQYTPIGHTASAPRFFQNTLDSIRQDDLPADAVIMYLSDQQYSGAEQDGSNTLNPIVRVTIMENYKMDDFAAENAAIENNFGHLKELIAAIMEDRRENDSIFKSFHLDDCTIFPETPIHDRWIGCTLTFTLRLDEAFVKTSALWP